MSNILNRIFKGVLGDILDKPKTPLGNLPKEDKIDKTRRGVIAGGVAAPVAVGAGVLNELPVEKVVDKFEGGFKTIIKPKVKPIVKNVDDFKNLNDELKFGSEAYRILTGENISPQEYLKRDLAEYLYWLERGESTYLLDEAVRKTGGKPIYELLEDVGDKETVDFISGSDSAFPKIKNLLKKYMGDADEYSYGSASGDELAQKLFHKENPNAKKENFDKDIVDWIKSKGIHKTKYYKQLERAGKETRS